MFGPNSVTKVLDFLSTHENFDYSIKEIAEYTGVHRRIVSRLIPTLEYYDVVKKVRKIDRSSMYKLDTKSKLSSLMRKLAYRIAEHDIAAIMEQEMSTLSEANERKRIISSSD